jgi:MFS family permease
MPSKRDAERAARPSTPVELGLRANWQQFSLLVLINAFVGAMVGLERTVLPLLAEQEFGLASTTAALSFLVSFGLVKAATNFFAGRLGDLYGRKPILILGWCVGIPVPLMIMWAPSWSWVVAANVLLGINQGLAWSTTVIMKIDLAGPKQRGLAMGLNEFAGYAAVALSALGTGYIAGAYGLRPEPFYLGLGFVALGLALSVAFVKETRGHAALEAESAHGGAGSDSALASTAPDSPPPNTREIFSLVSWRHPALSSASHAGLVNNMNDGLAWGLFPLFFAASGLGITSIGVLTFVYPFTWGIVQLATGAWSDKVGRKWLIAGGMLTQAMALAVLAMTDGFGPWVGASMLLGVGTAMVYPTLLAVIADVAHPSWRGSAVGVYRLWRDSGYAVGALLAGVLADLYGMRAAIMAVAVLTGLSGLDVARRMPETLQRGDGG